MTRRPLRQRLVQAFHLVGFRGQTDAQVPRPIGEAAREYSSFAEMPKKRRRLIVAEETEKAGAAFDTQAILPEKPVERSRLRRETRAHAILPFAIGERAYAIFQSGARSRPRAEPGLQPCGCFRRGESEAKPDPGKAEEFAEGAQNDDAAFPNVRSKAFGARADVHEGFVDNEKTAFRPHGPGEIEKGGTRDDTAIGIVRVDDNGEIGLGKSFDITRFLHLMSGERRRTGMFRIGGSKDAGAPGRKERSDERQQDLRAAGCRDTFT